MDGSGPIAESYVSKNIDWAPHIETLKQLHAEGKSAAQIAAAIGHGLTRNAVIGKVHRLRLRITQPSCRRAANRMVNVSGRSVAEPSAPKLLDGARPVKLKALPRVEKSLQRERNRTATNFMTGVRKLTSAINHTAPALERFKEGFLGQTGRLSLIELREGLCRFPIEQAEGPDRYCGLDAEKGGAYCGHHAARCSDGIPAKKVQPRRPDRSR